jgi:hypothetical protein
MGSTACTQVSDCMHVAEAKKLGCGSMLSELLDCAHMVPLLQLLGHWLALAGWTLLLKEGGWVTATTCTVSAACHLLVGHILQSTGRQAQQLDTTLHHA